MTAWSGNITADQTWASGDTIAGDVNIKDGATFYSPAGGAGGTLRVGASFVITPGSTTNGSINWVGGSDPGARCIIEASTNQRHGAWGQIQPALTGDQTFRWCTIRHCSYAMYLNQTGGTLSVQDVSMDCCAYGVTFVNASVPSTTFSRVRGRDVGVALFSLGAALTENHVFNDVEIVGSSGANLFVITGNNTGTIIVSRWKANNVASAFSIGGSHTGAITMDDGFLSSYSTTGVFTNNADANVSISASVIYLGIGDTIRPLASIPGGGISSSGNDLIRADGSVYGLASSVGDYIAGLATAEWTNVDIDTGNTTSTSTPAQYAAFAANRGTAAATPNKPLTISNTNTPTPTSSSLGTFTWNTGIRSNGMVFYDTVSHASLPLVDGTSPYDSPATPEEIEARVRAAYPNVVDEGLNDWTGQLTGTQAQMKEAGHSVQVNGVQAGTAYYCRRAGYDPLGRFFVEATESTVTTGAGAAAGAKKYSVII